MSAFKATLATLLLSVTCLAVPALAQVAISPPILEVRLDQPAQVHTLRLHNFEAKDKQVVVSVANWTQGENGDVKVIPPTELSLDRWVIVSPLKFTMKARSAQTVRVAIRPAVQLPAGEHRAIIYFDEVLPPAEPGDKNLRGRFRIGAAIYGYQGEPVRIGTMSDLRIEGQVLRGEMASSGNAHARLGGFIAIWRAGSFPGLAASPLAGATEPPRPDALPANLVRAESLPALSVMPGSRRSLKLPITELEPGEYIVEVRSSLSGKAAEPQALRLVVPKPPKGS